MRRVLLAIGNPLRRDDGVGLGVGERLQGTGWTVIAAGQAVENALGLIERLAPDLLVVVDAAEMGLPPGSARRLPLTEGERMLSSTHALPLPFLLSRLTGKVGELILVGIQPADRALGEGLTPPVQTSVERVVSMLRENRPTAISPLEPG
ncbi:MAG: hydrogenase 3 maturation endopeptidase HyCI [Candidatus Acetothermia bacterium]|nr:hydrogenase 3 maturation endopeptidase HyCI [Candidatus Acetothermia bacterium]